MNTRCRRYRLLLCRRKRIKYSAWGLRPQGWNSKKLTGTRTSSGAWGLIRRNAKNLTRTWHLVKSLVMRLVPSGTRRQVLHGCRQLVSWDVRLSPATSATLIASSHHSVGHSSETAVDNTEEGGDDVKSSCPLYLGLHTCYNGWYKEKRDREVEQIS